MRLSINEVQLTAHKAARGCGLHEGLCEDLARAAAWLCRCGLDGVGAALVALEAPGARLPVAGVARDERWIFEPASAAVAGPSAFDLLIASPGLGAELVGVDAPLLLIGHAGVAASDHARAFRLSTDDGGWTLVGHDALGWSDPPPVFSPGMRVHLADASHEPPPAPIAACLDGVEVDERAFARIAALAARTYVPATEASRARGAGAGLVDND